MDKRDLRPRDDATEFEAAQRRDACEGSRRRNRARHRAAPVGGPVVSSLGGVDGLLLALGALDRRMRDKGHKLLLGHLHHVANSRFAQMVPHLLGSLPKALVPFDPLHKIAVHEGRGGIEVLLHCSQPPLLFRLVVPDSLLRGLLLDLYLLVLVPEDGLSIASVDLQLGGDVGALDLQLLLIERAQLRQLLFRRYLPKGGLPFDLRSWRSTFPRACSRAFFA